MGVKSQLGHFPTGSLFQALENSILSKAKRTQCGPPGWLSEEKVGYASTTPLWYRFSVTSGGPRDTGQEPASAMG